MMLGIEIGGTKLQLGVGDGRQAELVTLRRAAIDIARGAEGIRSQIETLGAELAEQYTFERIAVGFGGPVDAARGRTVTSHQVAGWNDFPLEAWLRERFDCPVTLANDCDCAALAEARFGAGREASRVFYVTVGTGIGGGWVQDQQLQGRSRPAIAEIGHLRPGPAARGADDTVESIASGLGLARRAARYAEPLADDAPVPDGLAEFQAAAAESPLDVPRLAQLAETGNPLAAQLLADATETLGWAIAQVITLMAPEVIVVGGGVSMLGEPRFYEPLRNAVRTYVFGPLNNSYQIVPPKLGEEVVVHGALAAGRTSGGSPEPA